MEKKLDLIINELKTVKEDINSVKSELKEDINSVRSELKEDIKSVRSELNTVKEDTNSLQSKFNILESNQLTFLNELREQRLENQTREKIFLNEFNKIHDAIKFVNRRVADVELEVDDVKRQVKEYRKNVNLG